MKIETVFVIVALAFIAALGAVAWVSGGACHEEPPSKRVEIIR